MKKLLFIFMLLNSSNTLSAEWLPTATSNTSKYSIDRDSLKLIDYRGKQVLKTWVREEVIKDIKDSKYPLYKGDSILVLEYFDCENQMSGAKKYIIYRKGQALENLSSPNDYPDMKDIVPDSIQAGIIDMACSIYEIKTGTRSYMKAAEK